MKKILVLLLVCFAYANHINAQTENATKTDKKESKLPEGLKKTNKVRTTTEENKTKETPTLNAQHPQMAKSTKVSTPSNSNITSTTVKTNPYRAKQLTDTKQQQIQTAAIYQKYLGISSKNDPQYAAKKNELYQNNPNAYKQMTKELNDLRSKKEPQVVYRVKYNQMTEEQKKKIDDNPQLYRIID